VDVTVAPGEVEHVRVVAALPVCRCGLDLCIDPSKAASLASASSPQ
jgi:hypothetical protein